MYYEGSWVKFVFLCFKKSKWVLVVFVCYMECVIFINSCILNIRGYVNISE